MRVINFYVKKSKEKADYSNITKWVIDETSRKKWHNYISTFVNLDTRKISSIVEWKWSYAIKELVEDIETHNGDRNNITAIWIDFSPAFTSWVKKYLPNAAIIYDVFHFIQFVNKALDRIRRQEAVQDKILKWSRYLWLRNSDKLTKKQNIKLEELKTKNEVLFEWYRMKENIKEFFCKQTKEEAEYFLHLWCEWVDSSWIHEMKKVVKTIKSHWSWIMNYIEYGITSWIVEWLNSVIQTIKRRARWYRNVENFKTMIYLKLWDFRILDFEEIGVT
jgi:transposase